MTDLSTRTILVALALLLTVHASRAGEIFPFTDPETGSQTYTLKQGRTVAQVSPSNGANVFSIEVEGIEYLATPPDMHDFFGLFFGTPVLYPTPNRVRDARFTFAGKEYALPPNFPPHRIHGLVVDADWQVADTSVTGSSAAIRLMLDFGEGTTLHENYPFSHQLYLSIEVSSDAVRWTYEVENSMGTDPVPFGFGLHPVFIYQGARDRTSVALPASHLMEAENFFPTGRLLPAEDLDYPLGQPIILQDRNFDDVFWGLQPGSETVIDFADKNREIRIEASEAFSHAVLWSAREDVFSVEHQTSSTDAHNLHAAGKVEEASLQICPPGETCTGWVQYRFALATTPEWSFEDQGFQVIAQHCESCHGFVFTGARAKNLWESDWEHGESQADIAAVIANGIPGAEMPAFNGLLEEQQIEDLAALMVALLQEYPQQLADAARAVSFDDPRQTYRDTFRVETIVTGLGIPWSIAFLPDGRMLVTEREGTLRIVDNGVASEPVSGTPAVWAKQDGGLLATALSPHHDEDGWIYLSFADPGEAFETSMTKIVRGRIVDNTWVNEEVIWQAPPTFYTTGNSHYGTRLLFEDDYLYFSVGDRGQKEQAQDLSSPLGKIHRIYRDGNVPADNPFAGEAGAWPSVWSYGHRNPQGLAFSVDGELWSGEHGPVGGDELNRIDPGSNYGWPLVSQGTAMDGSPIPGHATLEDVAGPALVWQDGIAPSSIAFYDGKVFPGWRDSLFVASLMGQELRRVEIENGVVRAQELLLSMIGRIRDVQAGPDGFIYLAVEKVDGMSGIMRLVPAEIPSVPIDTGIFIMD